MKKLIFPTLAVWAVSCGGMYGVGGKVTRLAGGFEFTEGPALAPNGDIYYTDIRTSIIHICSVSGKHSVFRENSGKANGLLFDTAGNLYACECNNRQVTLTAPDGNVSVLADAYQGQALNSPNDLWIDPGGGVYFTDPRYGDRRDMKLSGENVYYIPPGGGSLIRVIEDLVRPNGIVGSQDGRILYVADHRGGEIYSYRVNADGTLCDKKLFASVGADGLCLDQDGNLYAASDAVYVFNPRGKLLRRIEVPEQPSNVCFGKDGRTLFITARKSLYAVRL